MQIIIKSLWNNKNK